MLFRSVEETSNILGGRRNCIKATTAVAYNLFKPCMIGFNKMKGNKLKGKKNKGVEQYPTSVMKIFNSHKITFIANGYILTLGAIMIIIKIRNNAGNDNEY